MRRGDIWTASGGKEYAGKPRPVVIVQDDTFPATDSITVCPFTTDPTEADIVRLEVVPTPGNGLKGASRLMVDKLTSMPARKLSKRIGHLSNPDMLRLNRAMMVFLGIASASQG